ncbi:DMT family transporter [Tenuibacillus multivorans]|uniref:Permease of the drug/metabolite transporter (DMT) superfamily n=1 Tax=Tenuibacillus multivorans TaxID=237069 RepID=A0A1H0CNG5_9BACI|nr:DMT family transporter [Tenuibacillus multivorans]GEL76229.1 putative transporter YoaV [Tenuibacillus multivorans]SDN59392.1 Permease of the drug/metabolite transporter (DMT) superfamily [Tenuibacillus multivorans]
MSYKKFENTYLNYLSQHKWLVWVMILTVVLIWGYAWTLMKEALQYMGPFTFSAFRFGTGTLAMFIIIGLLGATKLPKESTKHLVVVGILQTSIVFLLVMYGLKFVEAGKSSVLLYSMPIWSTLLAVIFLKEKTKTNKVVGLLIGLIGLFTILGWDIWVNQTPGVILGELLIVLSAISWGASNVYYRKKLSHLSQLQVNAYQMLFGTLGIILVAVLIEGGEPIHITPYSIYIILFTGVLASAFCFTAWFFLLSIIDMATATISTLLVPVFGLFFGWLLLDEPITWSITIGSFLILFGIFVTTIKKRKST